MNYKRAMIMTFAAATAGAQTPELFRAKTIEYVTTEAFSSGKLVKGAPYSADEISETTQTLADGNRIVRKSSARVYRDKDGRTRTERTLSVPGVQPGADETMIMIDDPVAGLTFQLEPGSRAAIKMPAGNNQELKRMAETKAMMAGNVLFAAKGPVTTKMAMVAKPAPVPKTESLGKQTVEGIEAEGTRTTITIPAGDLGNERPIDIVSERWFSPELQTFVLTRRNDPMIGETVYRLSNISRAEPDPSLFQVPPGYSIKDAVAGERFRIINKD